MSMQALELKLWMSKSDILKNQPKTINHAERALIYSYCQSTREELVPQQRWEESITGSLFDFLADKTLIFILN